MIVPSARLIALFAVVVPPGLLVAALSPAAQPVAWLLVFALGIAAVLDAWAGRSRLRGVAVELPDVTRLSCGRRESLAVTIRNPGRRPLRLRMGLAFPPEVTPEEEERLVDLPAGSEQARVEWPCRTDRRGRFHIPLAAFEHASPLGLWDVRGRTSLDCELRAYPSLASERRSAPALFLRRGAFGAQVVRQAGKGRDFEKLREYVPGDGYDEIHWKATAKRGRPVTKVFQIERTQEIYVALDVSRLSARETRSGNGPQGPTLAIDRFINAALLLALAAEEKGDLYGLLAFSDRIERFVRARNGQAHYSACRDALYNLEARIATPDFEETMSFIRLRLRKRALILFLTALDDPMLAEGFLKSLELIQRQHLLVVGILPPAGVEPLFTSPGPTDAGGIYSALAGHIRWHGLQELKLALKSRGARLEVLRQESLCAQVISEYVQVRQRQLL